MLSQTSAFLTRSIRQESRLLSHHLVRGGMVVLMLYLLMLQVAGSRQMGASGLRLISSVMSCCYWCLTLLGVMYFAVAITEEKEEDTLPLLRMTGVRNFTLLLGKSLPRLAVVMLLILVAAPFLMLAVTLGGVVSEQIIASLLGLMCYAFCLSQAGLFASTVCRNSSNAVRMTFLIWLVLEFGHWLFYVGGIAGAEWRLPLLQTLCMNVAGFLSERTMWNASGIYLMFDRSDSIWHPQMLSHLIVGIAFFGLSWRLFERFNQAAIAQGATASSVVPRGLQQRVNSVQSRRSWEAALEWKSWQFEAGGRTWFWVWLVALPVVSISLVFSISVLVGDYLPAEVYAATLMTIGLATLALLMARLFGNVFNREIYQQTLVSLCMLPMSRAAILWRMALGLMPSVIPPVVCFGLGFVWMSFSEPGFLKEAFEVVIEPWLWAGLGWVAVTVHVGVLLSVYFRHGAMLIAVVLCLFVVPFMAGILINILAFTLFRGVGGRSEEAIFRYMVPIAAVVAEAVFCYVAQRLILNRVEEVAAK